MESKQNIYKRGAAYCAGEENIMELTRILSDSVLNKEESRRASRNLGVDINALRRMGLNEHPYGMSPKALSVFVTRAREGNLYGDFGCTPLKRELAKFYGLKEENFLTGAGSSALIEICGTAFLNPGDEVIMCPTFAAFLDMAGIRGAKSVVVPLTEDKCYDLEGILAAITEKTKMIVVCNPNNPTGQYLGEQALREFVERVPDNIVLVFDEAYLEFATAADCKSMLPLIKEGCGKPVVILKTFSKYYGMAGVRVGYAVAEESLIAAMSKCPGSSVNRAGMYAAIEALKDQDYYQMVKARVVEGINYLEQELKALGCEVYHTQTNFIMFEPHRDYMEVRQEMINRGILISCPMMCRVSAGTMEDNQAFIEAMKEVLKIGKAA